MVALITFSLVLAVAGGILFGRAVTSSADALPQRAVASPLAGLGPLWAKQPEPKAWPADRAVEAAEHIARSRAGIVSFAAI